MSRVSSARGSAYLLDRENEWCYSALAKLRKHSFSCCNCNICKGEKMSAILVIKWTQVAFPSQIFRSDKPVPSGKAT